MKNLSKIFFAFWSVAFLLFAYWQLNDSDPWIWVPVYIIAAIFSFLAFKNIYPMAPLGVIIVICCIFAVYLFPESVGDWINFEIEQKDLSMKTQNSEEARETFGLLIIAFILTIAFLKGWKTKNFKKT
jgi:uncharacterized membrane protein